MTRFALGPLVLQVDVAATRAYYKTHGEAAGGCACAYCRNFLQAVEALPAEVLAWFDAVGIDPRMPVEAVEDGPAGEGCRFYEGQYMAAGHIEDGEGREAPFHGVTLRVKRQENICGMDGPGFEVDAAMTLPWLLGEQP